MRHTNKTKAHSLVLISFPSLLVILCCECNNTLNIIKKSAWACQWRVGAKNSINVQYHHAAHGPFFYDNPSRMTAYFCFKKQFNLPTSQVLAAHSAMGKRGKVDVDEKRACVCICVLYAWKWKGSIFRFTNLLTCSFKKKKVLQH